MSVLFFELIQIAILYRIGINKYRYLNLYRALKHHSGEDVNVLQRFEPEGITTFLKFMDMFFEWFNIPGILCSFRSKKLQYLLMSTLFIMSGIVLAGTRFRLYSNVIYSISLFILIYLLLSVPFLFYIKRVYSLFPITIILLAAYMQTMSMQIMEINPTASGMMSIIALMILLTHIIFQWRKLSRIPALRSNQVEINSKAIDMDLDEHSKVYFHACAFRFFWQSTKRRLMAADDQIMDNQNIIDWAIQDNEKHVMLSSIGGTIPPGYAGALKHIKNYDSPEIDSDNSDCYGLFEIDYSAIERSQKNISSVLCATEIKDNQKLASKAKNLMNNLSLSLKGDNPVFLDTMGKFPKDIHDMIYYYIGKFAEEGDTEFVKKALIIWWQFIEILGMDIKKLELNSRFLSNLNDYIAFFPDVTAGFIKKICQTIEADTLSMPELDRSGQALLFTVLENEKDYNKAATIFSDKSNKIIDLVWPCILADYIPEFDLNKQLNHLVEYIEGINKQDGKRIPEKKMEQILYEYASKFKSLGYLAAATGLFHIVKTTKFHLPGIFFHLGEIYFQQGDKVLAEICFKKCLKMNSRHRAARNYLLNGCFPES